MSGVVDGEVPVSADEAREHPAFGPMHLITLGPWARSRRQHDQAAHSDRLRPANPLHRSEATPPHH